MSRFSRIPDANRDAVLQAGADVLRDQPAIMRRKDSLGALANLAVQLSSAIAYAYHGEPIILTTILIVGFLAQILLTACTEGATTPANVQRIADRVAANAVAASSSTALPVYDIPSSGTKVQVE